MFYQINNAHVLPICPAAMIHVCICINERYRLSEFTTKIKTGRQMAVFYSICISLNQLLLSELLLWKSVVLICSLQTRDTQAALL